VTVLESCHLFPYHVASAYLARGLEPVFKASEASPLTSSP